MRLDKKEAPEPIVELAEEIGTSLALIDTTSAAMIYAPGVLTTLVDKIKAEVRQQITGRIWRLSTEIFSHLSPTQCSRRVWQVAHRRNRQGNHTARKNRVLV